MENRARDEKVNKQKNMSSSDGNEKSELSNDLNNVKESIAQAATHVKENASEYLKDAQEKTAEFKETFIKYVKENPLQAIGFSILAGFLASTLVRR